MKRTTTMILMLFFLLFTATQVLAAEILLASGAGYKKMVKDIGRTCKQEYGLEIKGSFGNLGQVMAQVKNTGLVQAVIGDRRFFTTTAGVDFAETSVIGTGKLVLAWRKGLELTSVDALQTAAVGKVAIPNLKKAIYGRAGAEFLESSGLMPTVRDKLIVVATVPQVTTYLVTGEVDAGFSNLTDTLSSADKIGGYLVLEQGYKKIDIMSGIIKGYETSEPVRLYRECLASDKVRAIARKHGL